LCEENTMPKLSIKINIIEFFFMVNASLCR
jgi:hypothetical protein